VPRYLNIGYGHPFLGHLADADEAARQAAGRGMEIPEFALFRYQDTFVRFAYLPVLRALFALDRGAPAEALDALQAAVPYDSVVPGVDFYAFFGSRGLSSGEPV
jgi:hypothetical protein